MNEAEARIEEIIRKHASNCSRCRTDWADKRACLARFLVAELGMRKEERPEWPERFEAGERVVRQGPLIWRYVTDWDRQ